MSKITQAPGQLDLFAPSVAPQEVLAITNPPDADVPLERSSSEFPDPTQIPPTDLTFDPIHRRSNGVPSPALEEQLRSAQEELQGDILRYEQLRSENNAACSTFDLSLGYTWQFSATLKRNHISYRKAVIHAILTEMNK